MVSQSSPESEAPPLEELVTALNADEVREIIDARAKELLGIGGDEFVRRWRAGEYRDDPDRPGLAFLSSLIDLLN